MCPAYFLYVKFTDIEFAPSENIIQKFTNYYILSIVYCTLATVTVYWFHSIDLEHP